MSGPNASRALRGLHHGAELFVATKPGVGVEYQWWRGAYYVQANRDGVLVGGGAIVTADPQVVLDHLNIMGDALLAHQWIKAWEGYPDQSECPFRAEVTRTGGQA